MQLKKEHKAISLRGVLLVAVFVLLSLNFLVINGINP